MDPSIIDYFSHYRGKLKVYSKDNSDIWFTEKDTVNASVNSVDDKSFLQFSVTDTASERVGVLPGRDSGKAVVVELDGKVIVEPIIGEKLGKYFQVSGANAKEALNWSILLKYGSLSHSLIVKKDGT